jgi:acylphosphatase
MLLHAVVKGRVQGVGFRYWVRDKALALGLAGWVRNNHDGSVETEAEGTEDQLFEFEQALWKGPVLSRVTDVRCERMDHARGHTGFEITR